MHVQTTAFDEQAVYKLLTGLVVPRPIALVTTCDGNGRTNAAPFSFFNALAHDPPIVALGLQARGGRDLKDTAENIRVTGEFTVHIVDEAIAEKMNVCATDYPADIDEIASAGFTTRPGANVATPRLVEAPAALECRRYVTVELGRARNIVLGEVLSIDVRDDVYDTATGRVSQDALAAIGRMAGGEYITTRSRFSMPRPG
jgi:flavin reductase (DIM6/NTAB) family NADH-FMN oxidoreductase RutF